MNDAVVKCKLLYSNKVWIEIKLFCTVSTELYYKTENDAKEGCQYCLLTIVQYIGTKNIFFYSP